MGQCYGVPTMVDVNKVKGKGTDGAKKINLQVSAVVGGEDEEAAELLRKRNQFKKRVAVAAQALRENVDITIPNHPKRNDTFRLLEQAVTGNLLFSHLSLPAKVAIFNSMAPMKASVGTVLIKQGDEDANTFFVLEQGTCDVLQNDRNGRDRVVQTCCPGSAFGELALLYASPRAATVIASSDCKLWVMKRDVYTAINSNFRKLQQEEKWALMDKVPALKNLSEEEKNSVVDALELKEYADKDIICYKGEPGDTFYLIKEGAVTVKAKGQEVAHLNAGEYFGERSLLVDEPRNADVVADGYVVCHTLSRKIFMTLLGSREELWQFGCLRKVPVLSTLSDEQIWQLLHYMGTQTFNRGEFVFRKDEPGDTFYIVNNGNFRIFNDDRNLAEVGAGSCFGELALLSDNVRAAHVMSLEDGCKVMTLKRDVFTSLLGSLESMQNVWRYEALRSVPLFASLTNVQVTQIASCMEEMSFAQAENIITKGEIGKEFFVIQQGEVMVTNSEGKELSRKGPKDYFGELALLKNEPRAATVCAVTATTALVLNREQFDAMMGPLKKTLSQHAEKNYNNGLLGALSAPLSVADVHPISVLGQGAFGKVILARYLGKQYAVKMMWKSHVVKMGLQEHVKREAKIMKQCKNDFMVNLIATGKTEDKLYMMMEPVLGGELFAYLRRKGEPLPENETKFYVACVVQALEYLQVHHIAYRDLKPENLLIAKDGYLKVADFGFAKKIRNGRTFTLCGTPDYLAPELVLQCGHTYAVDWWALGVLIFEMVNGYPPFYHDDKVQMYKSITDLQYYLPRRMSKECKDLVRKLLQRNPAARLGMGKVGATAVKAHPWFAGFDWHRLATKTMTPPYIPKVAHDEDTSNFDSVPEESEKGRQRYVSTGMFRDF